MLDVGATPPEDLDEDGRADGPARVGPRPVLLTLVPNSAIQLVDFEMTEQTVAHTRRRFFEDATGYDEPSLHVAADGDDVFYHPLTGEPCDPSRTYAIGGVEALAPYLDTWLPMPFMRVSRSEVDDGLVLDEGPSNWTRVHISRTRSGSGWRYRVVLAIDTLIETEAAPGRAYVGPTLDDLKAGAAFRFSDDVNDIAWFVSEAWVDDWLRQAFEAGRSAEAGQAVRHPGELEHLACYLTLLAALKEAADLPALRFMEPNAVGAYAETVPVDLALDLGTARVAALLEERHAMRGASAPVGGNRRSMWQLAVRDLSEPWRTTEGTFPSRVVFSRASFGNEAMSRWSGRTQAFNWPSPVRLGPEAERLALMPGGAEAVTGLSSPMHYVWDERPSRHVWRFAGPAAADGARRNPVVSGSVLAYLSEAGELVEGRGAHAATTKPRFSRSALVTLLVAEIILHAVAAINAPEARERRGKPTASRRLERILITPPAGMAEGEVGVLRRRIESAVKLVWHAMGWAGEAHPLAPPPPSVTLVADAATSTQIAYLENEIAYKFRGKPEGLLAVAGQPRAGFAGARALRIATLDIGGASSGLSVATWEISGDALAATRHLVEGFETGCDDVVKAYAERYVLSALANRLVECKHADPPRLIEALLGPDDRGRPAWVGDLGRRLTAELLAPAANALLRLYAHSEADAGDAPAELSIATLLASVGGSAKDVADRLDVIAADDGADGFAPLDVAVPFLMRDLAGVAREVLRPMLDNVVKVLAALDCDLVLLSGGGALLPAVSEILLAGMPLRPDRLIQMHRHRLAGWFPVDGSGTGRSASGVKLLPAAGALLQGRGTFGEGGPAIVLRPLERATAGSFIGRIGADGRIGHEDIMFEPASPSHGAGPSGRSGGPQRARTTALTLPVVIGSRTPSLVSWPARATWVIERDPTQGGKPPKLPIKTTVELAPPERGKPASLKLVAAVDADGGRLDPLDIVLRLKTRRFAEGYWLDTGHLVAARTGTIA